MSAGVFVLGGGAVGSSLGAALAAAGERIVGVHCRDEAHARRVAQLVGATPSAGALSPTLRDAAIVLVCVPDPAVRAVAEQAAAERRCTERQVWLHTAGSRGAEALAPLVRS